MERDREATERKLLDAVGQLAEEVGFENLGVNAVAARSGVSKILMYRYFGSLDGLVAEYVRRHDFWINSHYDVSAFDNPRQAAKAMFREQAARLRSDAILRRIYRWELSTNNPVIESIRKQREDVAKDIVDAVCALTGKDVTQVSAAAAIVNSAIAGLSMTADYCAIINGIDIRTDEGWEAILAYLDVLVDKTLLE